MKEIVIAKILKKSEGPNSKNFPNSLWKNTGHQVGAALTSLNFKRAPALTSFFDLQAHTKTPAVKNYYYSQVFLNFVKDESYEGTVNWTKLRTEGHVHFKGYDKNSNLAHNFEPEKTILLIRKIANNHFDTYFISDNDPAFLLIKEEIKKVIGRVDGMAFIDFNFNNFNVATSPPLAVIAQKVKAPLKQMQSQGRSYDSKRRKVTEIYAEEITKDYLVSKGYTFIAKFGKPFDLQFSKGSKDIRVEVKGSTLKNLTQVDVTENELLHAEGKLKAQYALDHLPQTEVLLIVVEDIKINEKYMASGGQISHCSKFIINKSLEKWRKQSENYLKNSNTILKGNAPFAYKITRSIKF